MKLITQGYSDRVRFILQTNMFGTLVIEGPEGWDTDDKELARHEQYHGVFPKFSNSLKFIGNGKDYILTVKKIIGINADLILKKQIRHPQTDEWVTEYWGFLDMSTFSIENNKVSLKFNSGGVEALLKAREGQQIEIDRLTSLDGVNLEPLTINEIELEGRRIYLRNLLEEKTGNNFVSMINQTNGQTRGSTYPVPLKIINQSHEELMSPILSTRVGDDSWERTGNGETGLMFFAVSQRQRELKIKIKLKFKALMTGDDINHFTFYCRLAKYSGGVNYNFNSNPISFISTNDQNLLNNNYVHSYEFDSTVSLNEGDSLALVFDQNMDGRNGHSAHLNIIINDIDCEISIEEDSFMEKTISKTILSHELADRIIEIITNKKYLYSEALGRTDIGYEKDGIDTGALCGYSHGFWIRQFDKLPLGTEDNPNPFKPLTISLKDFMQGQETMWNLGLGIERINNIEKIRIESLDYFYNRNIGIILKNQVSNVKRSYSTDKIYSSLELGYSKGGDYEEAFGLEEYNCTSNFITPIIRYKNTYSKVSPIRADSIGKEFARRKYKERFGTEDTRYDTDIFVHDMKRGIGSVFAERKWADDFDQIPSGIWSAETATNLRLSPMNLLLRHSSYISASLQQNITEFINYTSSNGNSKLKTKLIGGNEYSEDGSIIISELKRPNYEAEIIEFNYDIDFNLLQELEGYISVNGRKIPKIYCKIQFLNEDNDIEYGYLLNCKINDGNFKLLKAF